MAAPEVNKKLLIYHTLYRLNLSFSNIVIRCSELRDAGALTAHSTKLFQGYTQELQAAWRRIRRLGPIRHYR